MSTKARLADQQKLPDQARHFGPQLIGLPKYEKKKDPTKTDAENGPGKNGRLIQYQAVKGGMHPIIQLFRNLVFGRVSQKTLVTWFLPLGILFFFGTLMLGIQTFPGEYSWKKETVSHIISPLYNPIGFWIPTVGFVATALLLLPLAGYVERCLLPVGNGVARTFQIAFLIGLLLLIAAAVPVPRSWWHLHIKMASSSTVSFTIALMCCGLCSFHERFRRLQQRCPLPNKLAFIWRFLPLAPVVLGGASGIMLAGRKAGYQWALAAGDALRPTPFWQLAFWEWIGLVVFFGFFFLFVLSVPDSETAPVFNHISGIKPLPPAKNSLNNGATDTESPRRS